MLIVNGLTTKAGGPVGFALHDGEIVAVRGPSGSGKSLMLRAIADLDPAEGEVTLDGTPRARIPAQSRVSARRKRLVGRPGGRAFPGPGGARTD